MLAFLIGIGLGVACMVWGGISHVVKSSFTVVARDLTTVKYRNETLNLVSVSILQQLHLIFQHDNNGPM